ncbi:hypothetical protein BN1221_00516c [Brenneria goodwinii]|uniref:Uncharacterized protein n=1 Tax=Brenneria goodwinii TaxID=1109412 RepID=A0A0G4JQB3_9GAMM|nr:hypothetical protein BN1221_00516c [Brenneria goodwinii]
MIIISNKCVFCFVFLVFCGFYNDRGLMKIWMKNMDEKYRYDC